MKIYIDADACPKLAKEAIYKIAYRLKVQVVLVANQKMGLPQMENVSLIVVGKGADVADDKIVELVEKDDLVITADIPLADRIVKKDAIGLSSRGDFFDKSNISSKLATRDLMDDLRSFGLDTGGPPSYSQKDRTKFINSLDKFLISKLK